MSRIETLRQSIREREQHERLQADLLNHLVNQVVQLSHQVAQLLNRPSVPPQLTPEQQRLIQHGQQIEAAYRSPSTHVAAAHAMGWPRRA